MERIREKAGTLALWAVGSFIFVGYILVVVALDLLGAEDAAGTFIRVFLWSFGAVAVTVLVGGLFMLLKDESVARKQLGFFALAVFAFFGFLWLLSRIL